MWLVGTNHDTARREFCSITSIYLCKSCPLSISLSRLLAGKTARVLAHGVAGGAMSVLRGGKFKDGFVSAGMSQVLEVTGAYNKLGVRAGARGFAGRTKNVVASRL